MALLRADPIDSLLTALWAPRTPLDPQVAQWLRDGRDPVAIAWETTANYAGMLTLLSAAGHHEDWTRASAAVRAVPFARVTPEYARQCAAVIRAAVPTPPTIEELSLRLRGNGHASGSGNGG
jgi:hypothetical protein